MIEPPHEHAGMVQSILNFLKGMTLTNALVVFLLVAALVPAYLLYITINDETMMGKFLSYYEEVTTDKTACTLRIASIRGGSEQYSITTGFAYEGSDRWMVGVLLNHKPDDTALVSYCATLELIVDFMRRPDAKRPTYPNTDKPMIWQYPPEPSRVQ